MTDAKRSVGPGEEAESTFKVTCFMAGCQRKWTKPPSETVWVGVSATLRPIRTAKIEPTARESHLALWTIVSGDPSIPSEADQENPEGNSSISSARTNRFHGRRAVRIHSTRGDTAHFVSTAACPLNMPRRLPRPVGPGGCGARWDDVVPQNQFFLGGIGHRPGILSFGHAGCLGIICSELCEVRCSSESHLVVVSALISAVQFSP